MPSPKDYWLAYVYLKKKVYPTCHHSTCGSVKAYVYLKKMYIQPAET